MAAPLIGRRRPISWRLAIVVAFVAAYATARWLEGIFGVGQISGTASFLVAPEARGKGVARALAGEVVRWHRSEGYRGIQFNAVVETNAPAVHLWQSLGWEVVGTVPGAFHHPEDGYVGLHVMFKDLTGA